MVSFSSISRAITTLRDGGMIIVVDDEDRENEGDLICAAEHIDEQKMGTMIRHTSGIIFLSMTNDIADQLNLPPMVMRNTSRRATPFTVSIEAAENVTTGVSAKDRVQTIRTACSPVARPEDLHRPGHVFPLRANDGGVLVRAGHTEASVDLVRLAGLRPCAVGAELMNDNGTMMRLPELQKFAEDFDVPIVTIADLIAQRTHSETCIRLEAESALHTATGEWNIRVYTDTLSEAEHVALVKGEIQPTKATVVRVHSECLTGDTFGSLHCDCGSQLEAAMQYIEQEGCGVIVYMRQEGRGIGLTNKIRAYQLQNNEGLDTVEANERLGFPMDLRTYGIGAQILKDCGVGNLRLLTNNPKKVVGLEGYGLHLVEQIPLQVPVQSKQQKRYLETKRKKMGHLFAE